MKKPALLSLIRIPPLCAIQRCTSERARWQLTAGGPVPFVGGVQWVEPSRSGTKKADAIAPALKQSKAQASRSV